MNLKYEGNVIYISSVDVSKNSGPGINELEFILTLYKLIGKRATFLIPKPSGKLPPSFPVNACIFSCPARRRILHNISQFRLANRLFKYKKYNLIIFRLSILPFSQFLITKTHNTPYVLKTLGKGGITGLSKKGLLGRIYKKFYMIIMKKLINNSLASDAVSKNVINWLRENFNIVEEKLIWIDNAVNVDRFYPISSKEARERLKLNNFDPIVGYVGNFPADRGGMQLVNVASRLIKKYPNIGFVILGNDEGLKILKNKVNNMKMTDYFVFPGLIPFEEIIFWINSLDVGVSFLTPEKYFASEQKVRQYLACGKPVVATPGSNNFLLEAKLGSLTQPDDLESIYNEIEKWLSMSLEEKEIFCNRAIKYVKENLSFDNAINKRLEIWSMRLTYEKN